MAIKPTALFLSQTSFESGAEVISNFRHLPFLSFFSCGIFLVHYLTIPKHIVCNTLIQCIPNQWGNILLTWTTNRKKQLLSMIQKTYLFNWVLLISWCNFIYHIANNNRTVLQTKSLFKHNSHTYLIDTLVCLSDFFFPLYLSLGPKCLRTRSKWLIKEWNHSKNEYKSLPLKYSDNNHLTHS